MDITNIHNLKTSPEDFNPFEFLCDQCGKTYIFTEEKIEKVKQKVPNTENDYFILCQFCKKGHMQPPVLMTFTGLYE